MSRPDSGATHPRGQGCGCGGGSAPHGTETWTLWRVESPDLVSWSNSTPPTSQKGSNVTEKYNTVMVLAKSGPGRGVGRPLSTLRLGARNGHIPDDSIELLNVSPPRHLKVVLSGYTEQLRCTSW